MENKTVNCTSCGAALSLKYRFSKMVACPYCGQNIYLTNEGLQPAGDKVVLSDYGSVFALGRTGKLKGRKFHVLGRIRFDYEDGFWDEWLMSLDDNWETEYWLQEDEGDFVLFSKVPVDTNAPDFNSLKVGSTITVAGKKVFVSEKNKAVVNGGEGELPFQVSPYEKADFVDGICVGEGAPVSIEFMPDEIAFNMGEVVELEEIQFDKA